MRKKIRKSFKQLLMNDKENIREIEEKIERRHTSYRAASN
ncbi:FbpB family small basic protein [Bacillus pseudomycoides]